MLPSSFDPERSRLSTTLEAILSDAEGSTGRLQKREHRMSEERLTAIEQTLDSHTRTLDSHTRTLESHTRTLESHTLTLESHTLTLESHSRTLETHTVLLEELKTGQEEMRLHLTRVDGRLDRLEVNVELMKDDIKQIAEGHAVTQAAIARSTQEVIAHIDKKIAPLEIAVRAQFG